MMLYQKSKKKSLLVSKRIHGSWGIFLKVLILCKDVKTEFSYKAKIYIQSLENQLCIRYLMHSLQVIYVRLVLETKSCS